MDSATMTQEKPQTKASRWPEPTTKRPTLARMEKWVNDSIALATDGCQVEPDGTCQHGHPSWLIVEGYI